jgi:NAD+ synthase
LARSSRRIKLDDILRLDYDRVGEGLAAFLRETLEETGASGYVIGVSGGVDSAASLYLAVKGVGAGRVMALVLPEGDVTPRQDVEDALELIRRVGVKAHRIDITPIVEVYRSSLPAYEGSDKDRLPLANLKARIRMSLLYYYANKYNMLVLGTTDRSEWLIGYFTKYGDGGVDVEPIIVLYKSQVRRLAAHLGVPERIAFKPSSPGLWPGHKAEEELGVSYNDVDLVLYSIFDLGLKPEEVPEATGVDGRMVARVLELYRASEHKRRPPRMPSLDIVRNARV